MSVRRHADRRSRFTILALSLLGATVLFAGCGDGAHLPAGATSADLASSGGSALDGILGGDPGAANVGLNTGIDDPVLDDYSGIDDVDALNGDDMWANAENDFDNEVGGLSTASLDMPLMDDPYGDDYAYSGGYGDDGYGYAGDGWGSALGTSNLYNSYGYGAGITGGVGMASYGAAGIDGGMLGGEMIDPTIGDPTMDPTFDDLGGSIDDPSIGIGAADTSIDDGGFGGFDFGSPVDFGSSDFSGGDFGGADFSAPVDFGGVDVGGFDAGAVDMGPVGGFDGGVVDTAPIDMGGMDIGGAVDVSGGFDIGAGAGGMDIGGMDAGIGF
jgi:hypothetical protein